MEKTQCLRHTEEFRISGTLFTHFLCQVFILCVYFGEGAFIWITDTFQYRADTLILLLLYTTTTLVCFKINSASIDTFGSITLFSAVCLFAKPCVCFMSLLKYQISSWFIFHFIEQVNNSVTAEALVNSICIKYSLLTSLA